jgi:hypothetical protein
MLLPLNRKAGSLLGLSTLLRSRRSAGEACAGGHSALGQPPELDAETPRRHSVCSTGLCGIGPQVLAGQAFAGAQGVPGAAGGNCAPLCAAGFCPALPSAFQGALVFRPIPRSDNHTVLKVTKSQYLATRRSAIAQLRAPCQAVNYSLHKTCDAAFFWKYSRSQIA